MATDKERLDFSFPDWVVGIIVILMIPLLIPLWIIGVFLGLAYASWSGGLMCGINFFSEESAKPTGEGE